MKNIIAELRIALLATLSLAVILCGLYPLVVWAFLLDFSRIRPMVLWSRKSR